MIHPRTAIRYYAYNLLKDNVDVANRVYLNRPNPLLIDQMPALVVYFSSESVEVSEGDRYVPQEYERKLNLVVDVLDDQPTDPNKLLRVEDKLDYLARQVEREFYKDSFFVKLVEGYAGNSDDPGLLQGIRLLNTIPDHVELGSDRLLASQTLTFELTYLDDAFVEEKGNVFSSYLAQIMRVGWDGDTVDPILIAMEGDL